MYTRLSTVSDLAPGRRTPVVTILSRMPKYRQAGQDDFAAAPCASGGLQLKKYHAHAASPKKNGITQGITPPSPPWTRAGLDWRRGRCTAVVPAIDRRPPNLKWKPHPQRRRQCTGQRLSVFLASFTDDDLDERASSPLAPARPQLTPNSSSPQDLLPASTGFEPGTYRFLGGLANH